MDRDTALDLLKSNVKNKNLVKHCLACEAVLAALAKRLGEDEATWRLAGLLHDVDYDQTADSPQEHARIGAEMLREAGVDSQIVHAVLAHNDHVARESALDKALWCVDPLTGLIVAAALIRSEKKLSAIDTQFVLNRMKEKSFARGANREQIRACEQELDLTLEEFVTIGLKAMQDISDDLGL
ncbi:MAG: HDIG domain-containing protein [Armatimonadota bacterium]|nr:MAG: HDIG domain-containing protein [Armatimonadota bacterium]